MLNQELLFAFSCLGCTCALDSHITHLNRNVFLSLARVKEREKERDKSGEGEGEGLGREIESLQGHRD